MGTYYSQPVNDQRSIILLGETGAGKSSFGNFLLNREGFATGSGMLSTTQKVEQQSFQYTQDDLNIQLHVFDLPGLNDPRKIDTTYLNNTYSALKNCAKCMSTLFAIVINISNAEQLDSVVKEIHSFLSKISLPDFNITENALLVFSNAHKLGSTREIQERSVYRVIGRFPSLCKLWTIVRYRHILVDSVCYSTDREYWLEKMKEIITFTRPKVRVLLLGPHRTAQNDVLKLLRSKKCEMGGSEELPGYLKNEVEEVNLDFEGMSLSFQKSVDFLTIGEISESDCLEKSNALSQLTSLIQAITEIHTFTAFCVLIRMDDRLRSPLIEGIKSLANAITEDKPNLFYDRCFFLFTHPNLDNTVRDCDRIFTKLSDMKEMRTGMGNKVSILNLQSQTATQGIFNFLKQTVSYSHSMKQKCYGKDYVSNLLSKGFDLSAPPPEPTASCASYLPSKATLGLLALQGGGAIALAGAAAVLLAKGGAAPAVVPGMLFAVKSSVSIAAPLIAAPLVATPAIIGPTIGASVIGGSVMGGSMIAGSMAPLFTRTGVTLASTLGATIAANTALTNTTLASTALATLLYKLLVQRKKKQEREYDEYDVTKESLECIASQSAV